MYLPPKEVIDKLAKYGALPKTDKKEEIDRKYLSDEIDADEFYSLAMKYLEKQKSVTLDK